MGSLRKAKPLPIAAEELARLRGSLNTQYGSFLAPAGTGKPGEKSGPTLVIRVPGDEPDMVNDVEQSIEFLNAAELQQAGTCLFVGNVRTLHFPPQPLRDLMASRLKVDRKSCHLLRGQMKVGESRLFKAPEDPRRLVRLAIRLQCAKVSETTEEELAAIARNLGPQLASPAYQEVRAVYLIAEKDEVRMEAPQFLEDVRTRWGEETERRRLAEEIVQKEAARRLRETAERSRLLEAGVSRPPARLALAPLRRPAGPREWSSDDPASPPKWDPQRQAMYDHLDELLGLRPRPALPFEGEPFGRTSFQRDPAIGDRDSGTGMQGPGGAARDARPSGAPAAGTVTVSTPDRSQALALQAQLEASGYACLLDPAPGIALAAERDTFPNRILGLAPTRLDVQEADRILALARSLQVDLAIVTCPEAEPEARKRLIATKVRWVPPTELGELAL